ncbi:hypothetical protein Q6670_004118 [Salmonella enterica]|nr:hypothetical protein [Salmonella enterica]
MTDSVNGNHRILTAEDQEILTQDALHLHANYEGDHPVRLMLRAMARKILSMTEHKLEPEMLERWLNSPTSALPVGVRTHNILETHQYRSIREVFETGYERMAKHRGFGLRCRSELLEVFADYGLVWTAGPCELPVFAELPNQDAGPTMDVPVALLNEMALAVKQNLERYERDHGRFASRGNKRPEYDRLMSLSRRVDDLLGSVSA